jgi:hypothetical protein
MGLDAVRRRCVLVLVLVSIAVVNVAAPRFGPPQVFIGVKGKEPIPRQDFKTWSLFLLTDADWLVPENAQRLQQLYDRSKLFGRIIGEKHAAVWFWKRDMSLTNPALAENVDVERAVAYAKILGRKPSEGPYLVFTTTYPDELTAPSAYQVITLQGRSAKDIDLLLDELGNQLVMDGVVRKGTLQQPPESDDFWSAWFDATRHALTKLKFAVCFSIRAPSFTIEVGCKPGGVS